MAKYRLYKNNNRKSAGYGKYYAKKAAEGMVDMSGLIAHMAGHNSAFSKGVITGVLADLVECVRELAYEGKSVKIDNLGIRLHFVVGKCLARHAEVVVALLFIRSRFSCEAMPASITTSTFWSSPPPDGLVAMSLSTMSGSDFGSAVSPSSTEL